MRIIELSDDQAETLKEALLNRIQICYKQLKRAEKAKNAVGLNYWYSKYNKAISLHKELFE